MPVLTIP